MVVSFVAGASVVGLVWLLSSKEPPSFPQTTVNLVSPSTQLVVQGPVSEDAWANDVAKTNLSSVVALHLGGNPPSKRANAILYATDGTLLASAQSLVGADDITAVLADGSWGPAELIATDLVSGVAVLKVNSTDLPAPTFSTGSVTPRDRLVGIAAPAGDNGAIVRTVEVLGDGQVATLPSGDLLSGLFRLSNELDADWAGAPIAAEDGGIVAMAVRSDDGVNYAIPTELARAVAYDLIENGEAEHVPWLGIDLDELGLQLREERDVMGGVLVRRVWDRTPAARAGLVAGDVIVGFGTVNVLDGNDLAVALRAASPGDLVELRVARRVVSDAPGFQDSDFEFSSVTISMMVTLGATARS